MGVPIGLMGAPYQWPGYVQGLDFGLISLLLSSSGLVAAFIATVIALFGNVGVPLQTIATRTA
jgi:hypothetical protein